MNTETFFQQFELFADAPNGIAKLRELILQLAVQGKLVPQNPDDEPAAVLLERIKAEKERLVKEGKIKKSKKLPDIKQDEIPFELPNSWQWERLENICSYIQRGKSPKYADRSDICVISQKCIQWDGFDIEKARFIEPSTLNKYGEERFLTENDILWNSTGRGTIGRVCICKNLNNLPYTKVVADSHVTIIRCLYLKSEFVLDWLSSDYVQSKIDDISSGTTKQTELNTSTVKNHLVPLPPLAEQKRIVEKVDRLMELCDRLETQKQQQQTKTLQLGTVATSRLTAAKTPEAFKQHWRNISNNFDLIYSTPENIKQLRQTILQLAVMGKLVPQNPDDEPASVLLAKIKAEKEKLIKEGKIKKSKKLKAIAPNELPFKLPEGWKWVRLNNVCQYVVDCLHSTPKFTDEGKLCIDTTCLNQGEILFEKVRKVSEATFVERIRRLKPESGDILFSREGTIGLSIVVPEKLEICLGQRMMMFRTYHYVDPTFFRYILISPMFVSQWQNKSIGTAARHVNIGDLKKMPIPLPPLPEQHRIVAKVNQLMTYCDELEAKLTQSLSDKEKLMDTAVYQLLTA